MGHSSWSDSAYDDRAAYRSKTSTPVFTHDADVKAGKTAAKIHDALNPLGVKVREARDSAAHPESNPVVVVLDQTGSMRDVIEQIQKSLPALMGLLTRKNYLKDPAVMFAAIGDVPNAEVAPLQVGQFESGLEMEDDLSRFLIEGAGGGTNRESYQNAAYFIARHTVTDAWEKRGRRGFVFFIGDELNYANVSKSEVQRLIGDSLQADIPTEAIYRELAERWMVFFILPKGASNGGNRQVIAHWQGLVGAEHVLELEDASAAAQLIATQIGLCEDSTDIDQAAADLKDMGAGTALVRAVTGSVSRAYKGGGDITKLPPGTLAQSDGPSQVKRL